MFTSLDEYGEFDVIEPIQEFCKQYIIKSQEQKKDVKIIEGFFPHEDISKRYDFIICAGVLQDTAQPMKMLEGIREICKANTRVYINTSNAKSLHRFWGREMGVIQSEYDLSSRNKQFEQETVYDSNKLQQLCNKAGLEKVDGGTFFLKPFSHIQMQNMLDTGQLTEEMLDALYELAKKEFSDFGCEIWQIYKAKC